MHRYLLGFKSLVYLVLPLIGKFRAKTYKEQC